MSQETADAYRRAFWIVVIAAAVLAVFGGVLVHGQIVLERSRAALVAATGEKNEAYQALSYACGYVAGQRALIAAARLKIPDPRDDGSCDPHREVASRHGFKP